MADLLADTDLFVDHLRGTRPLRPGREAIAYSVLTRAELLAGRAADEERVRHMLAPFRVIDVDPPIAELAGRLRRDTGTLLPDALIAATALHHGLVLVTGDGARFEPISGLRTTAPLDD